MYAVQDLRRQPRLPVRRMDGQHLGPVHAGRLQFAGAHVMAEGRLGNTMPMDAEPGADFRVVEPRPRLAGHLGSAWPGPRYHWSSDHVGVEWIWRPKALTLPRATHGESGCQFGRNK